MDIEKDLDDIDEIKGMLTDIAEHSCRSGIGNFAETLRGHIEKSQIDFPGKSLTAHQILTFINHVEETALNSLEITVYHVEEVPNAKPH